MQTPGNRAIDSHVHFWDIDRSDLYWMTPDMPRLRRSFTPPDLQPALEAAGVEQVVIVQAARLEWDHRWWLGLAERYAAIGAVVGWVDLSAPDIGDQLDRYAGHPAFRGVRATAENVDDPAWLARADVRRGIRAVAERNLSLDLLVKTPHLPHVPAIADDNPDLPLVIDHLAKPPLASGDLSAWYAGMRPLIGYPQIRCKVSGLLTEAGQNPDAESIRPAVQFALEHFGPSRVMWGSDWPVATLVADYETTFSVVTAALGPLSEEERAAIYRETAAAFYRLG